MRKIKELNIRKPIFIKMSPDLTKDNVDKIIKTGKKYGVSGFICSNLVKGKKLSLIVDTVYCEDCIKLAKDADLLICESTFNSELKDKAKEFKHLTSTDAATIAKKAKVKKLVLTHFSQRYKSSDVLLKEAKKVFKNSFAAKDFMKIRI